MIATANYASCARYAHGAHDGRCQADALPPWRRSPLETSALLAAPRRPRGNRDLALANSSSPSSHPPSPSAHRSPPTPSPLLLLHATLLTHALAQQCELRAAAMSSPSPSPSPSRIPVPAPPPAASSSASSARRSFTLPARISSRPPPAPAPAPSADGIETLFVSSSTKIVSFTAARARRSSPARRSPSRRHSSRNASPGTPAAISWGSATERTLAAGVLRIYRVTSSNVSFLNSGNLLHTIFPKSQCWCVDGEAKFVLRIRQDSYYRIELPYESEEDKEKVEQFKLVLDQVLQYEKTPCPFNRAFEVQLPERPKTPPRRRPKRTPEKAKKWLFDKTWVPEADCRPSTPNQEGSDSGTTSSYEEDDRSSVNTDSIEVVPESPVTVMDTPPKLTVRPTRAPSVAERAKIFGTRAVTAPLRPNAPPSSGLPTPEPSRSRERRLDQLRGDEHADSPDATSLMSSVDSFHSVDTAEQNDPPSPPYLDAEAELLNPWADAQPSEEERGRSRHRRQISEVTLRASSDPVDEPLKTPTINVHPASSPGPGIHISSAPSTPPLVSDSDEDSVEPPFLDTPPDAIRLRKLTGASQRRAFSPMPHPQNLIVPATTRPKNQFTTALIRKTCEIVLGPPAHLVTLMLSIAAKISNGAFGFNTYRVRHTGEKIPCSWESSDEDNWSDEDDFGIPLSNMDGPALRRRNIAGELD